MTLSIGTGPGRNCRRTAESARLTPLADCQPDAARICDGHPAEVEERLVTVGAGAEVDLRDRGPAGSATVSISAASSTA